MLIFRNVMSFYLFIDIFIYVFRGCIVMYKYKLRSMSQSTFNNNSNSSIFSVILCNLSAIV